MGFSQKTLGTSSGAPKPAEIPYFCHHVPRISTTPNSFDVHERNAAIVAHHNGRMTVRPSFTAVQTTGASCPPA